MEQQAVEDLLYLLEVRTRPGKELSPKASLETLPPALLQSLLAPKRPRFALPEEFDEGLTGAVALSDYSDLLFHVPGVDPYVVSALRKLRQLDPDKFEKTRKDPSIARLPIEQLSRQEDADVRALAQARKWAALVDLLRPRVEESEWWTLEDAILLFLAWWGLGNDQELQACGKKATERFRQLLTLAAPEAEGLGIAHLQIMALIFWKTGEESNAVSMLDLIDEFDTSPQGQGLFSYWHGAFVVWKRFKEDCDLIRQFFDGAPLSPPFLGSDENPTNR